MSFDWCELLNLAIELKDRGSNEADLRSSISRAYYASFCTSRNYLRDKQYDPYLKSTWLLMKNGIGVHSYVIKKFKEGYDPDWQDIGDNLERLFDNRKKADYNDLIHTKVTEIEKLAQFSIELAEDITQTINKF